MRKAGFATMGLAVVLAGCKGSPVAQRPPEASKMPAVLPGLITMRAGNPSLPGDLRALLLWVGDRWGCARIMDTGEVACWRAARPGEDAIETGAGLPGLPCGPLCAHKVPLLDWARGFGIRGDRICVVQDDPTPRCYISDQLLKNPGTRPPEPPFLRRVDVELGASHGCLLANEGSDEGTVSCWGANELGQLGVGGTERHESLVRVDLPESPC